MPVHRGREVTGFAQDQGGVDVHLADGERMRAMYLVAADGGRSAIRKAAGIGFPGWDATRSSLIAEVEVTEETPAGIRVDETGIHGLHLMEDGRTMRVIVTEQQLGPAAEPTLADLGKALTVVYGTDFGVHNPTWISRFTDATRQAAAYRSGRVLLAGDAAHIHHPAGGQGIGLGIQDAVNLGWKLAQVVKGISPDSLLDTYHAERHPAGARTLEAHDGAVGHAAGRRAHRPRWPRWCPTCCRSTRPGSGWPGSSPAWTSATTSARDTRCSGAACPISTWPPPTVRCGCSPCCTEPARCCSTSASRAASGTGPWADRVQLVDASYDGVWELPVIGTVSAPAAVLVRPDGYVAWAGDGAQTGLGDALATWFGPAEPAP